ncbi:hypothetical protein PIB30_091416 [Stylosanthes scabra]|uniref:Uncharacterized protein n=1 Tax=Stylosanthes scabra TaxID=79078 RepID=A0ABU6SVS0_9FABA|nr:hypothetical protein [Stylosanthes scabra]
MRKESENESEKEWVRFKGAGAVARVCHGKGASARSDGGPKTCLNGLARTCVRGARARGPSSNWSESTTCQGADAPRPSCRRTAVRARQESGANAPHTCVASAECDQAHRADAPRPSRGHANKIVRTRGGSSVPVTIANLAIHRHREEEMNRERMRHNQTVQEAAAQRAREANKGKAREVVPDSEEEESEEMYSSPSEDW